jgi:lysophospholipase L1-like esterase
MFFLGKLSVATVVAVDLALFIAGYVLYCRMTGKARVFACLQCAAFFFLQLFLLLFLAPLRPEGLVVHLSGYSSGAVKITPVVQGKADTEKTLPVAVRISKGKQYIKLDLLRFKDKPRDYVFEFGAKPDGFDISGFELYTSFFSYPFSIVEIPGEAVGDFFGLLRGNQDQSADTGKLHATLKHSGAPVTLLFRLTDDLHQHIVLRACLIRALFWSMLITTLLWSIVLIPTTARLALQHANKVNCTVKSAMAYYWWSAVVVCLSLTIFVLIAEFSIRFYYRDVLSTASGVNYFHNKSYKLFRKETNSHNFRGKEFQVDKGKKFRVVVMGDSITYGQGVYPSTLRYTDILEQKMNTAFPGHEFEVINLGVCGNNLPEHIRMLPLVKDLHPDFVLYQWFINDMEFNANIAEIMAPGLIGSRYWHEKLLNNSALYFLIQKGWRQIFVKEGKIKEYDKYINDLFADNNSQASKTVNERLIQLLDGIKTIGVPYGVVLFPHAAFKIQNHPFAFMHERIMKVCEARGIPCLDLRKQYTPYDDHLEQLWANRLDPHPSALAHGIAATAIFESFGSTWQNQALEMSK